VRLLLHGEGTASVLMDEVKGASVVGHEGKVAEFWSMAPNLVMLMVYFSYVKMTKILRDV
jgi:hypothetical protein